MGLGILSTFFCTGHQQIHHNFRKIVLKKISIFTSNIKLRQRRLRVLHGSPYRWLSLQQQASRRLGIYPSGLSRRWCSTQRCHARRCCHGAAVVRIRIHPSPSVRETLPDPKQKAFRLVLYRLHAYKLGENFFQSISNVFLFCFRFNCFFRPFKDLSSI